MLVSISECAFVWVTGRSGISPLQCWSVTLSVGGNRIPDVPGCTLLSRAVWYRESSPSLHLPQPWLPQAAEELHTLSYYQSTEAIAVRHLLWKSLRSEEMHCIQHDAFPERLAEHLQLCNREASIAVAVAQQRCGFVWANIGNTSPINIPVVREGMVSESDCLKDLLKDLFESCLMVGRPLFSLPLLSNAVSFLWSSPDIPVSGRVLLGSVCIPRSSPVSE